MFGSLLKSLKGVRLPGTKHPCDFDMPGMPGLPDMDVDRLLSETGVTIPIGLPEIPTTPAALFAVVLNTSHDMLGAVKVLALALPETASIQWACESCRMVLDKLPAADLKALQAAELWLKVPGVRTAKLALEAAQAASPEFPGSWAAQAASLAGAYGDYANPMKWSSIGSIVSGGIGLCAAMYSGKWKGSQGGPPWQDPEFYRSMARPATPGMPSASDYASMPDLQKYLPPIPGSPEACAGCVSYRPFVEKGIAIASDLPEKPLPGPGKLPG